MRTKLRLFPHHTEKLFATTQKYPVKYEHPLVRYVTLHFRGWRAEITFLLCELNPIWCGFRASAKALIFFKT